MQDTFKQLREIQVLDATSSQLLYILEKRLQVTYIDLPFHAWDFVQLRERGKWYKVMIREPNPTKPPPHPEHVSTCFPGAFKGHVPAFLTWLLLNDPVGLYATVPEDARLYSQDGKYYAPHYYRSSKGRALHLTNRNMTSREREEVTYLAFEEL